MTSDAASKLQIGIQELNKRPLEVDADDIVKQWAIDWSSFQDTALEPLLDEGEAYSVLSALLQQNTDNFITALIQQARSTGEKMADDSLSCGYS